MDLAIVISPLGATGPLRDLVDGLGSIGVAVTIVDDVARAAELVASAEAPPALLLDLLATGGQIEDLQRAGDAIRHVLAVLPAMLPVAILADAQAHQVLACIRAGAGDVIDLALESPVAARAVVERISQRQAERVVETAQLASQRAMIEELLRDLIRTERRSIETEEKLAAATTGEEATSRAPAILLVEHDPDVADELADLLEANGVVTYAYATGDEAAREAETLARTTGLDLALVAAQLPGMDGLQTIRRLRERVPGLPAFLMTSVLDAELATRAADLGVVGFVQKPLANVDAVVVRLSQLASESLGRTREQEYLQQIKDRHERVLARYRALPRQA